MPAAPTIYAVTTLKTWTQRFPKSGIALVHWFHCPTHCSCVIPASAFVILRMKHAEFHILCNDQEKLIEFLCEHGVMLRSINCPKCDTELLLNTRKIEFRCINSRYETVSRRRVRKHCGFQRSARVGTWFGKSKLSMEIICRIVANFLLLRYPRQEITMHETGIGSRNTIVDWFSFCREVCVYWALKNSEKLGGPGKIVEIGEAKLDKRKYNVKRIDKGQWIYGGIERDSKKIFIIPVTDRSRATLLECIKDWILPGTTIISNCWSSYNRLEDEGFQDLTVNHSINFVDPSTGAHTQNIKRLWREVRGNIPRFGNKNHHLLGYLSEYLFKRCHPYLERVEQFFKIIGEMYLTHHDSPEDEEFRLIST